MPLATYPFDCPKNAHNEMHYKSHKNRTPRDNKCRNLHKMKPCRRTAPGVPCSTTTVCMVDLHKKDRQQICLRSHPPRSTIHQNFSATTTRQHEDELYKYTRCRLTDQHQPLPFTSKTHEYQKLKPAATPTNQRNQAQGKIKYSPANTTPSKAKKLARPIKSIDECLKLIHPGFCSLILR
jgi:hypothetical protein